MTSRTSQTIKPILGVIEFVPGKVILSRTRPSECERALLGEDALDAGGAACVLGEGLGRACQCLHLPRAQTWAKVYAARS